MCVCTSACVLVGSLCSAREALEALRLEVRTKFFETMGSFLCHFFESFYLVMHGSNGHAKTRTMVLQTILVHNLFSSLVPCTWMLTHSFLERQRRTTGAKVDKEPEYEPKGRQVRKIMFSSLSLFEIRISRVTSVRFQSAKENIGCSADRLCHEHVLIARVMHSDAHVFTPRRSSNEPTGFRNVRQSNKLNGIVVLPNSECNSSLP